jgi:dTDP-4-amino-4,6-dideoxygalactose transaminase
MIPFNKPYLSGKELEYIKEAIESGKISGNGQFTQKCQNFFQERYGFKKVLLTTSCTDALEMAAILAEITPGDEVIVPSYTFVSTANAFVLRGANIVFADSGADNPNIDVNKIESLISKKTKAIVIVHYAGISCDIDKVCELANKYNILVIEDAAQALDSFYKEKPLGGFGHLSAFSFHETKNVISGEGGMLVINDDKFIRRAEIIWEKGTNRAEFFRGMVNKYGWVDIGSSFLPSEIVAAFLYAQLENLEKIQQKRKHLWDIYYKNLSALGDRNLLSLPYIPEYASNNAHMFYILCNDEKTRNELLDHLKANGILAVFHYLSLHKSPFYADKYQGGELPNSDKYTNRLIRLPLFYELQDSEINFICKSIYNFFK